MTSKVSPSPADVDDEIPALIKILHDTGQRLEVLTAGEVDAVASPDDQTFLLLRHSQQQWRLTEDVRQATIIDALPANIALLDARGNIISVNAAWRRFAAENGLSSPDCGIGTNYLEVCDSSRGDGSSEARQAAEGIRAILDGGTRNLSIEYACHWHTRQHWFLLTVAPLADDRLTGAVVMHLDVTEGKTSENRINYLNRVYAMLSGVNTLIVRVRDRDELFREACRIAVEHGKFGLACIGMIGADGTGLTPMASACAGDDHAQGILDTLANPAGGCALIKHAIREKRPVVCNDIEADPRMERWRDEALKHDYRSVIVIPLLSADEAFGVLMLYASEQEFFDKEEVKLLTELSRDITLSIDHIEKGERLDYLAYYDELTGLANRRLFLERVSQHMRSAVGDRHGVALFLVDLERFRYINDSLGRAAGDALLKQVAEWLIHNTLGDASKLARIGVDQFALVQPDAGEKARIEWWVEKKMAAFLETPFHLNDAVFRVAAKAGVALFPGDGADVDTLFKNAEAALKTAKLSGNRYLFYTREMTDSVAAKLSMENQLRRAMEHEEYVIHYQPKMNIAKGQVTGAEALIRWNDPRTGLVAPDRFIPLLEETGLILEVGRWVLRKALKDCMRWHTEGFRTIRVAVNVSALQLRSRHFIDEIEKAMSVDANAAVGLEIEITESVIMEDIKRSITTLAAIRALGVTIAIDDFGTGFSSLSYLSRLPVDTLKIDRSFVNDMTADADGLALVSNIINLARSLSLNVVAEGVETDEQLRLLRLLKCDEFQGFLFGRPIPADTFQARFLAPPPRKNTEKSQVSRLR